MGHSLSQGYMVALPLAVLTGSCGQTGCQLRELGPHPDPIGVEWLTLPVWSGVAAGCRPCLSGLGLWASGQQRCGPGSCAPSEGRSPRMPPTQVAAD